eukprot:2895095-Prymnesium_polylepis.1
MRLLLGCGDVGIASERARPAGPQVLECRVETDGDVDSNYFVVQSRGKQKDFDDEKLEDIRHHIPVSYTHLRAHETLMNL